MIIQFSRFRPLPDPVADVLGADPRRPVREALPDPFPLNNYMIPHLPQYFNPFLKNNLCYLKIFSSHLSRVLFIKYNNYNK